MFGSQNLMEKWGPVLDAEGTETIQDKQKRDNYCRCLRKH